MKRLVWMLVLAGMVRSLSAESNWPQYRGPQSSGVNDSVPLPVVWNLTTGENIRWKTAIPGLGHASPIAWENRIYVATAVSPSSASLKVGLYGNIDSVEESDPQEWRLICVDGKTGEILWNTLAFKKIPKVKRHTKATHCNSTPATDGKRIVAILGSEGLFCFSMDGVLLWKKELGDMNSGYFKVREAQWGFGSSPVLHDSRIIVQSDVQDDSFVAVFDAESGKELWRTSRVDVPTWSTPLVADTPTGKQIILNGWKHSGGYDYFSGKEIWKLKGGGDIPVPSPILVGNCVILTSAHGRYSPIRSVRLTARGDISPRTPYVSNEQIVWANRGGNYMQTPIFVNSRIYACRDSGILSCFDFKNGKRLFEERVAHLPRGYTASPVSDGRHLYICSEQGEIIVVPATDTFSVSAVNELNEICMATPAISNGLLLFRTRNSLIAVGSKPF
ncbi:MAG TPA: hypothetical protein EYQ50_00990 [Verrucomicrobiales bacterium]|nr:hypothetical protein [Verrucomicrobiales bacterium]